MYQERPQYFLFTNSGIRKYSDFLAFFHSLSNRFAILPLNLHLVSLSENVFRKFCQSLENQTLKSLSYKCVKILNSVLCRSPLGSNYSIMDRIPGERDLFVWVRSFLFNQNHPLDRSIQSRQIPFHKNSNLTLQKTGVAGLLLPWGVTLCYCVTFIGGRSIQMVYSSKNITQ